MKAKELYDTGLVLKEEAKAKSFDRIKFISWSTSVEGLLNSCNKMYKDSVNPEIVINSLKSLESLYTSNPTAHKDFEVIDSFDTILGVLDSINSRKLDEAIKPIAVITKSNWLGK